jgi:2-C-methyl-D-erythritol 2,4-cyclodiphosphate synthase
MITTRTGLGFDSHLFSGEGTLVLGGVPFPGLPALKGHSDGDALLHAIVDALLGAVSAGDIGQLFPDTSPEFKGLSSLTMLNAALKRVQAAGFEVAHVDAVVVAEKPKLAPVREKIALSIARALYIPPAEVSIKGKTQEGLAWFGDGPGGIAVWATVNVESRKRK